MDLRRAVSATIKYADFFSFPLTAREVHYWLITNKRVSFSSVRPFVTRTMSLSETKMRTKTSFLSTQKTQHAQKLINNLRFVLGLRLVALTGSVAAGNSHSADDIDLLFVTAPHTLWLIRPLVLFLISILFRRRHPGEDHTKATNAFCPNLWLDSLSLTVPSKKQNLYTAHEVLQIVPIFDRGDTYRQFLFQNIWTKKYLANAYSSLTGKTSPSSKTANNEPTTKNLYLLLAPLNYLFYLTQLLYMYPKKTTETVTLHTAFLHTTDYSSKILSHLGMSDREFRKI